MLLVFPLLLPVPTTTHLNPHTSVILAKVDVDSLVPLAKPKDYNKEVLERIHKLQAEKKAADDAAQAAREEAQRVADAQEAQRQADALAASQIASQEVVAQAPVQQNFTPSYGGGYAYGYCTYYVASRRSIPSNWGNANQWLYNAGASGFSTGSVPRPGAIAWTGAGPFGHVAYVESVYGGSVTISEMNFNGGWNRVSSRTVPAGSFTYIY